MIDIGGPALLRAAAKNFVDVVPLCEPERYGEILGAASERRHRAGRPPPARRRGVRPHGGVRGVDRLVVRRHRDLPTAAPPLPGAGGRARLRREPAPARRLLRGGRRPPPPALTRRAARRPRALVQQPQRPRRRAGDRARVHAADLRDRQAREPLRLRRGGVHRGGLREGARLRPGLGLRRRRRAQPQGVRRARRPARRAVRRGADRARLRRRGAGGPGGQGVAAAPPRPGAARLHAGRPRLPTRARAGSSSRTPTPRSTTARA